ncbi:phosphotransferase family protein [Nocardia africana]|uniref:Phosphotransferase family protein n=1 Tax=Nocardia africana TaxID=134964 RepID=A0ABW6NCS5_9NOCA
MNSPATARQVQTITDAEVRDALSEICPEAGITDVGPGPSSYSNRLWRADSEIGPLLVRIPGRTTDPEDLRAAVEASRIASEAGIPTVRYHTFAATTRFGLPVLVQYLTPGENATAAVRAGRAKITEVAAQLGSWVGQLHRIRRDAAGSVLEPDGHQEWAEVVSERVYTTLRLLPASALPAAPAEVEQAFLSVIAEPVPPEPASLLHGDLYLDNVLVDNGVPTVLLDFEHARYGDRFADFGKLTELVFEWWPGSEEPFRRAYAEYFPPEPEDVTRLHLANGLYALTQIGYFARWQPDLVPFYRSRLADWLPV